MSYSRSASLCENGNWQRLHSYEQAQKAMLPLTESGNDTVNTGFELEVKSGTVSPDRQASQAASKMEPQPVRSTKAMMFLL